VVLIPSDLKNVIAGFAGEMLRLGHFILHLPAGDALSQRIFSKTHDANTSGLETAIAGFAGEILRPGHLRRHAPSST
jgi:hypothetical protein